ncbi:MAG: hypothetical protein IKC37_04320 [Clostridia bacterium]|nr:hypothetical protein [Clostridia bacterium]
MKFYFLSSLPCALSLGGAYFGKTDNFARHAEVCAKDEVFVEFRPQNALPITFFITEQLPFQPPERCEVYLLPDAIAIYAKDFMPCDFSLKVLFQTRLDDCAVTCFQQGERQICIETKQGMFVNALPPSFFPKEAQKVDSLLMLRGEEDFCLIDSNANLLLYEKCESVDFDGEFLRARLPLRDSKGRKADCAWRLSEGGCERVQFTLLQEKFFPPEELIAFAFFESILFGGDFSLFLNDRLLHEKEKIPAFLGNFLYVLPQEDPLACGLIYQKADRLYEVKIFRVEIKEGKITDIHG